MRLRMLLCSPSRWKYLVMSAIAVYCFCIFTDGFGYSIIKTTRYVTTDIQADDQLDANPFVVDFVTAKNDDNDNAEINDSSSNAAVYYLSSKQYPNLYIEEIVGESSTFLANRLKSPAIPRNAPPKVILSWDAGHSGDNLGGCLDWNCKFSIDRRKLNNANAVLTMTADPFIGKNRRSDQYVVFFNQESPVNSNFINERGSFFNTSLNFRRDTITSSPYGYTVKLAPRSRPGTNLVLEKKFILTKKKTVAWFVSHCGTHSLRERYVRELQKFIKVDVYGTCGDLRCARGGECEKMLDTDYHFYIAFENSVCKDYITEKLWNQGFQRTIIPLVLKREHVEPFAPPNSFIAADDFENPKELAGYLKYLINNKTAYMEYFEWRKMYKVIFLDGRVHDQLERPWGFCQVCRLLWQNPLEKHIIGNFKTFWTDSCEESGTLVQHLIGLAP